MLKVMRRAAVVCLGTGLSFGLGAGAQSAVDGAIGGTVQDQTGAVVPKASVTIRSNGTNAEQRLAADDSGFFRAIHLQPGSYTVTVEAPGFEAFKSSAVTVEVGLLTDAHPRLTLGASTETILVTSDAPSINTTSPDFSQVVNQMTLEDLPVANYRWSSYALLTPGVVADRSGFGLISFRGQSTLLNNVTFDGTDDNQAYFSEERGRTRVGYSSAKASIQEFQVNTSNYSVEYGRSAGGVVNAVTKSGTNEIHGEAYFYDRDAGWGAENPFVKHAVQVGTNPVVYQSQVFKPKDWRKQSGIGFGGPIIKDKLFYFFAFDDYLRNFPLVSIPNNPATFLSTPDAALPAGVTCASSTISSIDLANCQLAAGLNHVQPTVGLSSKGSPTITAANYTLVTPVQYAAAVPVYTSGLQGLISVTGLAPRTGDQNIFFPKLDWQINGKNHATVEGNRLRWTSPNGIQTGSGALTNGIASIGNDYVKSTFVVGKLDTSITSRLSNEVRYQYGRDFEFETNNTPTAYEQGTLLTPTGYTNPFGIAPNVSIPNAPTLGTPTFLNRRAYPDERRWQVADTLNLVRGNHNLKVGVDFIHTYDLLDNLANQYGSFNYNGTNNLGIAAYLTDVNTTNGCAYLPAGAKQTSPAECYSSYSQTFGPNGTDFSQYDYALFLQDEWKVNPRLSLTLGVRYEYENLPGPQFPNTSLDTQIAAIGRYQGSTSVFPDNKLDLGPRVGFAYDMLGTGKTVLRGGYGEFFARVINSTMYNALIQNGSPAGQFSINLPNPNAASTVPLPTFPKVFAAAPAAGSGVATANFFDKNFKVPEIHQADLTVEQDLGWNTTFSVTWLAAFGRRLADFVDTNLPAANGTISYTVVDPKQLGPIGNGTVVTTPFYGLAKGQTRPNPAYGAITDIFSGVNSNYEALVARASHRFAQGLQFDVNYTWSHALDYGENSTVGSNSNVLLDPANLHLDYGNSDQNVPSRLVANAIYQTPSIFHGLKGLLLNEYELAPSYQLQTGLPYSANVSGSLGGLATSTGGLTGVLNSINGTGGANRVPNLDRNRFQQPRTQTLDMRVSKRFDVKYLADHHAKIEVLAEGFNVANHLNVTNVNTTAYNYGSGANGVNTLTINNASTGAFGTTTNGNSTTNYSVRQVQLGARVQF